LPLRYLSQSLDLLIDGVWEVPCLTEPSSVDVAFLPDTSSQRRVPVDFFSVRPTEEYVYRGISLTHQKEADQKCHGRNERPGKNSFPGGASSPANGGRAVYDDIRSPPESTPVEAPVVPVPNRVASVNASKLEKCHCRRACLVQESRLTASKRQNATSHKTNNTKSRGNARNEYVKGGARIIEKNTLIDATTVVNTILESE
jgi:hypothetical protein